MGMHMHIIFIGCSNGALGAVVRFPTLYSHLFLVEIGSRMCSGGGLW